MRYAQGGGLTAEQWEFRARIRLEAAEMFAAGQTSVVTAEQLRVGVRSVQRWRKAYDAGGQRALCSKGVASLPKLSDELFAGLEQELDKGAVAHGWPEPDLDAVEGQDPDRPAVPQELHAVRDRADAAPARLEPSGARPAGTGA